MKRATGIGGIFFKANDPSALQAWYERHLELPRSPDGCVIFQWREAEPSERRATTTWAAFSKTTTYFEPSAASFMINYRVENLDLLLEELRREGVEIDERREESEFGKFAWITDPEGNRIELWEPAPGL